METSVEYITVPNTATHCNTLQHSTPYTPTTPQLHLNYTSLISKLTHCYTLQHAATNDNVYLLGMGWLRVVGSLKFYVSFAEYGLFYRALLQKRPLICRSLLIVATPYTPVTNKPVHNAATRCNTLQHTEKSTCSVHPRSCTTLSTLTLLSVAPPPPPTPLCTTPPRDSEKSVG